MHKKKKENCLSYVFSLRVFPRLCNKGEFGPISHTIPSSICQRGFHLLSKTVFLYYMKLFSKKPTFE